MKRKGIINRLSSIWVLGLHSFPFTGYYQHFWHEILHAKFLFSSIQSNFSKCMSSTPKCTCRRFYSLQPPTVFFVHCPSLLPRPAQHHYRSLVRIFSRSLCVYMIFLSNLQTYVCKVRKPKIIFIAA